MTGSVHNGVADLPSYHADYQGRSSSRDSGIGRIMDQIIGNTMLCMATLDRGDSELKKVRRFRIWRDTAHRLLILAIKRDNFVRF
jgi:hypothetical protein